jgi:Fe2+ transport system protein FeoA
MNPSKPMITVTLNHLKPYRCAMVHSVNAQDGDVERLMAMGVCAGRMVELVQQGDPFILRVYGTRIGVSKRLAEHILVNVCHDDHCKKGEAHE